MLIRLAISNYLSFKNDVEFTMIAANSLGQHPDHKFEINKEKKIYGLKSAALYGANASGKSNLIEALRELQKIIRRGKIPKNIDGKIFRLSPKNKNLPITLEVEIFENSNLYSYGISFKKDIILEEWLYNTTNDKSPIKIFERVYNNELKTPKIDLNLKAITLKKEGELKTLISVFEKKLLLNNETFITKNDYLEIESFDQVINWFQNKLTIISPNAKAISVADMFHNDMKLKKFAENIISNFDTGIDNFSIQKSSLESYLLGNSVDPEVLDALKKDLSEEEFDDNSFKRIIRVGSDAIAFEKEGDDFIVKELITNKCVNGKTYCFEKKEESDGTQRLIDLVPMLYDIINDRKVYVVDELDRSMHPLLICKIVELISKSKRDGQLIFSTHESNLLNTDYFRTDEIWFVEKTNIEQETKLYSLNEFTPRLDMNFSKGYLNGRFGAIPFLASIKDLNWE